MAKIQDIDIPHLEFAEAAAPGTPASGIVRVYAKADGLLYSKDDAGVETLVSGGAGGAGTPPDCKESAITTDVTQGTPNTWTDSGLSISLAAGTWLVEASFLWRVTQTGTEFIGARLIESGGSSTVYGVSGFNAPSNNGQEIPMIVRRRITLGSTTTVKAQGLGQFRTGVLVADSAGNVAANLCSYMTALAVTAA